MKKKVYIVSHSHWDREWYMAYEQHHMRLIELMDDLLELFETDPDFDSFHLDGQTIILDDYLEVRPEKRAAVKEAIQAGKLRIGPFYILQDDFLISSESNTRNMLVGMEESQKWGTPVLLGYFPDTFGNMGQTPQMMAQAGLPSAAFGRGVKPIGFDNEVLSDDSYTSQYSEMWWQGPDGSRIFGLLFANWYSNGNEIPANPEAAKIFWQEKLADAEKFASTQHLLMMNGVDHQPVQKDITEAIRVANELFPEYEFIHSNFPDYLAAVQGDLPEDLGTITGELTSQETDGWFTLANTASTRVYLKQWNTKTSRQLENIAEPLATMAYEVSHRYPHDQLTYAWKLLMQNHPHDSICGCSVDEVHREMMPRFEKAYEVGKYVAEEALRVLTEAIDTTDFDQRGKPFVVFNTTGTKKNGLAEVEVELTRKTFKEGVPKRLYDELVASESSSYHVVNQAGEPIPAVISHEQVRFDYDLPKEAFRIPYMKKYVTVTLNLQDFPAYSWESFALVEGENPVTGNKLVQADGRVLENDLVKVVIDENGSLSLTDKKLGVTVDNLLVFEDVGDIGNEYIFKQPIGDQSILSSEGPCTVEILENNQLFGKVALKQTLMIPKAADDQLAFEQQAVVDFRYRKAQRSSELVPLALTTIITLEKDSQRVEFETQLDNQMKDHRLRVLFPTGLDTETHESDSIYEVVTRPNQVASHWENPTNPQHQHAFVNLHDENWGMTVSNFGLNEYEIVDNQTFALTLLRCVGELGDWGYFPTPEAQCLGVQTFNFGITLHGKPESRYQSYQEAQSRQVPFVTSQLTHQKGSLAPKETYLTINGETFAPTALKRNQASNQLVLRGYNMADRSAVVKLAKGDQPLVLLNLLEEEQPASGTEHLLPYEIRTVGFKEE